MSLFQKYLWNKPFTQEDQASALAYYRALSDDDLWGLRQELAHDWTDAKHKYPSLRPDECQGNHPQEYRMRTIEIQTGLIDSVLNERGLHIRPRAEPAGDAPEPITGQLPRKAESTPVSPHADEAGRAEGAAVPEGDEKPVAAGKTALGWNIDRLRKECGWSFDQLATKAEIEKKLILGHVNRGKGAHPDTVKKYADAFTKGLGRTVIVAELEASRAK
jgi:hypothetical protein